MKVKVNTKSNFKNLNGEWLNLKEIVGTRVTCIIPFAEFGSQTVDFTLSEVVEINTNENVGSNLHPIFEQALKPFGL